MRREITVSERVHALGYRGEQAKRLAWSVGRLVADDWFELYGEPPPVADRPKTNGSGTHKKAVYPDRWQRKIDAAIEREAKLESAEPTHTGQRSLFGGER